MFFSLVIFLVKTRKVCSLSNFSESVLLIKDLGQAVYLQGRQLKWHLQSTDSEIGVLVFLLFLVLDNHNTGLVGKEAGKLALGPCRAAPQQWSCWFSEYRVLVSCLLKVRQLASTSISLSINANLFSVAFSEWIAQGDLNDLCTQNLDLLKSRDLLSRLSKPLMSASERGHLGGLRCLACLTSLRSIVCRAD